MSSLDGKLETFDKHAEQAVDDLLAFIKENRSWLIVQARGRLVAGHFRYRDKLMYELTPDQLTAETSEEVADAINYFHWRREISPPSQLP